MIEPRIEILTPKKLIGIRMEMSLSDNRTADLWRTFMPRRKEIKNRLTDELISMQNYGENWNFSPDSRFEKWAAVEVSSLAIVPPDMETYNLHGGRYAVFEHHGPASTAARTMQQIFGQWLPSASYSLDNREHFEILPAGYSPVDPDATEEIWIPINP
jgi:AraC family transcriptional regulator